MEDFGKVKGLLSDIDSLVARYGKEVLEYDVYVEQCDESDKEHKRTVQKWGIYSFPEYAGGFPHEDNEYFESLGGVGINREKKIILINVNY